MKKQFVSLAQIVQTLFPIRSSYESVLRTLSVAGIPYVALKAVTWQIVAFADTKIKLTL